MSTEQSLKDQIAALEGWAIKAKQQSDLGKYDEVVKLLKQINTQGRRLEWRGGLRHLPKIKEVKALTMKISQVRAAAQISLSAVEKLKSVAPKELYSTLQLEWPASPRQPHGLAVREPNSRSRPFLRDSLEVYEDQGLG